jgi:hypothetical protein
MYDITRSTRSRAESELGYSGLIGTALAADVRPPVRGDSGTTRFRGETHRSDALTAECTCPTACIRDHENE